MFLVCLVHGRSESLSIKIQGRSKSSSSPSTSEAKKKNLVKLLKTDRPTDRQTDRQMNFTTLQELQYFVPKSEEENQ